MIYFIAQKMFLLNILEAVLAYDLVKIGFMKENEVTLNGNTNDKSRGLQLIGPGYLQKVIKGVNWLLSPIRKIHVVYTYRWLILFAPYPHWHNFFFAGLENCVLEGHGQWKGLIFQIKINSVHKCLLLSISELPNFLDNYGIKLMGNCYM